MSQKQGGERYIKSFYGWHHLLTMLHTVIMRFDLLHEIETSIPSEVLKFAHIGLETIPRRSTLSDTNSWRSKKFFEDVYKYLYERNNRDILSSDSRRNAIEAWMNKLRIINSTTISLFSKFIFKGVEDILKQVIRWEAQRSIWL